MKITKGENPERYSIILNSKLIMLQVDEEMISIIVTSAKSKKPASKCKVLFSGDYDKFADQYNCIENGTFDFLLGFRSFLKYYLY